MGPRFRSSSWKTRSLLHRQLSSAGHARDSNGNVLDSCSVGTVVLTHSDHQIDHPSTSKDAGHGMFSRPGTGATHHCGLSLHGLARLHQSDAVLMPKSYGSVLFRLPSCLPTTPCAGLSLAKETHGCLHRPNRNGAESRHLTYLTRGAHHERVQRDFLETAEDVPLGGPETLGLVLSTSLP